MSCDYSLSPSSELGPEPDPLSSRNAQEKSFINFFKTSDHLNVFSIKTVARRVEFLLLYS